MKNNSSLVSRFHNKAGYTIELNYEKDLDIFMFPYGHIKGDFWECMIFILAIKMIT